MRLSSLLVAAVLLFSSIAFAQHHDTPSAPAPSPAPSAAPSAPSPPSAPPAAPPKDLSIATSEHPEAWTTRTPAFSGDLHCPFAHGDDLANR